MVEQGCVFDADQIVKVIMFFNMHTPTYSDYCFTDNTPFLAWAEQEVDTLTDKPAVFCSLISLVHNSFPFTTALEEKATTFLQQILIGQIPVTSSFIDELFQSSNSNTPFVNSLVILVNSSNGKIRAGAIEFLQKVMSWSPYALRFDLIQQDMIGKILAAIKPEMLPFQDHEDIHIPLMEILSEAIVFSNPNSLLRSDILETVSAEQIYDAVLTKVLHPAGAYLRYQLVSRSLIEDDDQSMNFALLLSRLLEISVHSSPTYDFILSLPISITIPDCLTFFTDDSSVWSLVEGLVICRSEWSQTSIIIRQKGQHILRTLDSEGLQDSVEQDMKHDVNGFLGSSIVNLCRRFDCLAGANIL
ncbi:hypothetical protein BLNAU_20095 [Blattamonas nauphoetae]|uniref:Uncharacterized protein n=1 Tax=Blattamonas nauphoetae TaxID=2049346 RepID=A0ABQ9WZW3_9EUKA|nr:hypothetical protein BLNAU_20095 [Blattamonas nauphoetae]